MSEVIPTWATAVGLLLGARLLAFGDPTGLLAGNLAGVAALLFILLPDRRLRRAGEGWEGCGLDWWGLADRRSWAAWGRGALAAIPIGLVIFPAFAGLFLGFARLLPLLPPGARALLAPYGPPGPISARLPAGFAVEALVQLLVVALPEELFYRGWVQSRLRRGPGRVVRVLGADLGPGFVATQALFAVGHLATLQPWRLGTFFPGLLFGWLRERTGGLAAPVFLHAFSNLFLKVLEASVYGG